MRKKIYLTPQTEVVILKAEGNLLQATRITYYDPNDDSSETQHIETNEEDDFWAGAKKLNYNYSAWDDEIGY